MNEPFNKEFLEALDSILETKFKKYCTPKVDNVPKQDNSALHNDFNPQRMSTKWRFR